MAEIVNLRSVRKAKAREASAAKADTNRAAFGRTKAERDVAAAQADRDARTLDGSKRTAPVKTSATLLE